MMQNWTKTITIKRIWLIHVPKSIWIVMSCNKCHGERERERENRKHVELVIVCCQFQCSMLYFLVDSLSLTSSLGILITFEHVVTATYCTSNNVIRVYLSFTITPLCLFGIRLCLYSPHRACTMEKSMF